MMRNYFLLILLSLSTWCMAQSTASTAQIRSNAVCGMCKKTIETEMLYEKGVKKVSLDLPTSMVTVEYDAKKTSPEKLRQAVAKLGYAADDVAPDMKAREALPACCKSEGCGMPGEGH